MRKYRQPLICILSMMFILTLVSCTQVNALAVEEGEIAIACGKIETGAVGGIFTGNVDGFTCELPSNTDTSTWTAEDWATLAEIID